MTREHNLYEYDIKEVTEYDYFDHYDLSDDKKKKNN